MTTALILIRHPLCRASLALEVDRAADASAALEAYLRAAGSTSDTPCSPLKKALDAGSHTAQLTADQYAFVARLYAFEVLAKGCSKPKEALAWLQGPTAARLSTKHKLALLADIAQLLPRHAAKLKDKRPVEVTEIVAASESSSGGSSAVQNEAQHIRRPAGNFGNLQQADSVREGASNASSASTAVPGSSSADARSHPCTRLGTEGRSTVAEGAAHHSNSLADWVAQTAASVSQRVQDWWQPSSQVTKLSHLSIAPLFLYKLPPPCPNQSHSTQKSEMSPDFAGWRWVCRGGRRDSGASPGAGSGGRADLLCSCIRAESSEQVFVPAMFYTLCCQHHMFQNQRVG